MNQNEQNLENILGGAPKAAVKEFPKLSEEKETGELDLDDLTYAVGELQEATDESIKMTK